MKIESINHLTPEKGRKGFVVDITREVLWIRCHPLLFSWIVFNTMLGLTDYLLIGH